MAIVWNRWLMIGINGDIAYQELDQPCSKIATYRFGGPSSTVWSVCPLTVYTGMMSVFYAPLSYGARLPKVGGVRQSLGSRSMIVGVNL